MLTVRSNRVAYDVRSCLSPVVHAAGILSEIRLLIFDKRNTLSIKCPQVQWYMPTYVNYLDDLNQALSDFINFESCY